MCWEQKMGQGMKQEDKLKGYYRSGWTEGQQDG